MLLVIGISDQVVGKRRHSWLLSVWGLDVIGSHNIHDLCLVGFFFPLKLLHHTGAPRYRSFILIAVHYCTV